MIREALQDRDIGILVNNVGVFYPYPQYFTQVSEDTLWDIVNVNIAAASLMVHIVLPGMVERKKGAIVTISSGSCCKPTPQLAATLPLLSRLEMASRDLNVGSRDEGPGHSGRGGNTPVSAQRPECSHLRAHHGTLCSGQPPSVGKAVGGPLPLRTPQRPPGGSLTCGDGTGTQCRPAPALCPGPLAGPCPVAPWDLGRQARSAVPPGRTEQRGRGLGAFGAHCGLGRVSSTLFVKTDIYLKKKI